jgi:mycofactocin biosynthesis protein MftB
MVCAASTEPADSIMNGTSGEMLEQTWRLSPSVALRLEPFGALAYHFGNRKLTFLKRPELVKLLRSFETSPTVRMALESTGVPENQWTAYLAALHGLAEADMIRPLESQAVSP